jgi:hypothetical protein
MIAVLFLISVVFDSPVLYEFINSEHFLQTFELQTRQVLFGLSKILNVAKHLRQLFSKNL